MLSGIVTKRGPSASPQAREDLDARVESLIRHARLLNLSTEELQRLIGRHWHK